MSNLALTAVIAQAVLIRIAGHARDWQWHNIIKPFLLNESRWPLRFGALVKMVWILRYCTENVIWTCQRAEALYAERLNKKQKVVNPAEGNGHEVLKTFVSERNVHFQEEIQKALAKKTSAGTMSIDSRWRSLDKYLPQGLHARTPDRSINSFSFVKVLVFSWLVRRNAPDQSPKRLR